MHSLLRKEIYGFFIHMSKAKRCGKKTPGVPTLIFLSIVLPKNINLKLVFLILIFVATVYVSGRVVAERGFRIIHNSGTFWK